MKIIAFLLLCGASSIASRSIASDHQECYFSKLVIANTLVSYNHSCPSKSAVITDDRISSIAPNAFENCTSINDLTLEFADSLKLELGTFNAFSKRLRNLSIKSTIALLNEKVFEPISCLHSLELKIDAVNQTLVESIPKVFVNLTEFKIFDSTIKSIGVANSSCLSCSTILTLSVTGSKIYSIESKAFKSFTSLGKLYLSKNSLKDLKPGTFDGLDKLKNLELDGNYLTTIRKDIFRKLKSLKALDLMSNNLTTIEQGAFYGLYRLRYLNLKFNELASIPTNIFMGLTSLKILDLSQNKLKIIPSRQFSGLSHLEFLSLTENEINKIEVDAFSESSIEYLRLGANNLSTLQPGIFNKMDKLESLTLFKNKIQEIPKNVFNGLKKLRKLELGHNIIKEIKSDAFSGLRMEELSLESNNLSIIDTDFQGLTVGKLDLAYNNITKIEESAFGNSSIEVLNLNNVRVNIDPASWGLPHSTIISAINQSHQFVDNINDGYYFSKEALLSDP